VGRLGGCFEDKREQLEVLDIALGQEASVSGNAIVNSKKVGVHGPAKNGFKHGPEMRFSKKNT